MNLYYGLRFETGTRLLILKSFAFSPNALETVCLLLLLFFVFPCFIKTKKVDREHSIIPVCGKEIEALKV